MASAVAMPFDKSVIATKLAAAAAETVHDTRGKAFEGVAEYAFVEIGCPVERDLSSPLRSQQIDLAVAHLGVLGPVPNFFLVECKYWEKPVDSAAVGYFLGTCRDRNVRLGVIISRFGLTGNTADASAAHSLAFGASLVGVNLIVVTEADLLGMQTGAEFVNLLIRTWMKAAATGGVGTST
jgi:hypothetical protein